MMIKTKIIENLLKYDNLSTSQLAEKCGYSVNNIDHIHSQLIELQYEGYFTTKTGKSKRGRKPKIYKIKRDLDIIIHIYQNHPELEFLIRTTEWIQDIIIDKRIDVEDIDLKNDIKKMLSTSPRFFWLHLSNQNILQLIDQWNKINNVLLPREEDEQQKIIDMKSRSYLQVIDFFAYCVFSDALANEITDDSWQYLQDVRGRMRDYHQDVTQYFQSFESMRLIMYAMFGTHKILYHEVIVDESKPKLNELMTEINKYILLQERENAIDFRDPEIQNEKIRAYNNIMKIFSDNE